MVVSKELQSPPIDPQNPKTPVCCGSTTDNVNPETKEAGVFERDAPGGSFKVSAFSNNCREYHLNQAFLARKTL